MFRRRSNRGLTEKQKPMLCRSGMLGGLGFSLEKSDMRAVWLQRFALTLFASQFAVFYLLLASSESFGRSLTYAVLSVVLCASLALGMARARVSRAILALIVAAILVTQASATRFYHAPLNRQLLASALFALSDVKPVVMALLPKVFAAGTFVFAVEFAILSLVARGPERSRGVRLAIGAMAATSIGCAAVLGLAHASPELRMVDAARALMSRQHRVVRADAPILPLFPSSRSKAPSILFLFGESIRASDYCASPIPDCMLAPRVNALLPDRIGLHKMRSIASYTAISVGAVFTGRTQLAAQPELAQAPTLFDLTQATRFGDTKPFSVYYTGQWSTIFERPTTLEATDRHIDVEGLFGRTIENNDAIYMEGIDRKLVDRFVQDLPSFAQPMVATLHWAGTHVPYYMDPSDAPFKPYGTAVTWSGMPELHRTYQNAIRAQDAQMARAIEAFVAAQGTRPWVVVFTSDHGEAFGEHHAIHHGQNLYNEQTHVPTYIAWGNGALAPEQIAHLRAHEDLPTSHLDILPTLLDVLGIWESALLDSWRARMPGHSLLQAPVRTPRAIPISNCSAGFPCPMNTWGMLGDTHSYIAQAWDGWFLCVDLESPESAVVQHPECDHLREASKQYFPLQPNGKPNR